MRENSHFSFSDTLKLLCLLLSPGCSKNSSVLSGPEANKETFVSSSSSAASAASSSSLLASSSSSAASISSNSSLDNAGATPVNSNVDGAASQSSNSVIVTAASLVIYDRKNHFWADNDDNTDVYVTEYLMALASAGDIQLKGISTSTSTNTNGYNPFISDTIANSIASGRLDDVNSGLQSGFKNLPTPTAILKGNLVKPSNGLIDSTSSLNSNVCPTVGSLAGQAIYAAANTAWTQTGKPLVFVAGGSLSAVADAYLIGKKCGNTSIENKIIVAWLGANSTNMHHYNSWADGWATTIALTKFDSFVFPLDVKGGTMFTMAPQVSRAQLLSDIPSSPLRARLIGKYHVNGLPGGIDADGPPAIAIMAPTYVKGVTRMSVSGASMHAEAGTRHEVPALSANVAGKIRMVNDVDQQIATDEWWRAMSNVEAYVPNHSKVIVSEDNFDRTPSGASLGTSWAVMGSRSRNSIISNTSAGLSGFGPGFDINTTSHNNNQYAGMIFDSIGANKLPGLMLRSSLNANKLNGIMLVSLPGTGMVLQSWENDVATTILQGMPQARAGDVWELRGIGPSYSIWRQSLDAPFKLIGIINNSIHISGAVSITNYNGVATPLLVDEWESGNITSK